MVVIHLYGVLESLAQRTVQLCTNDFDESMKALLANFPKLGPALRKMNVSVLVNDRMIEFEDCLRPMEADRIDIMPAIGGNGPAVFILAGSALIAGSATIAGIFAGTFLATAITSAAVAQFGLAMIIGGISQLLFKPPKPTMAADKNDSSYDFNGAVNVTQQGNVVPVGYGRMRVGSVVIAANIQTWDIPVPEATPAPHPATPPATTPGDYSLTTDGPWV